MRRVVPLDERKAIIAAYQSGRGMRDIARAHKLFVREVSAIIGDLKRRGGTDRPVPPSAPRFSFVDIIEQAASVFGVTVADIKGNRRPRSITRPRMVCCYVARKFIPDASYPLIGRLLGGKNHATVMHACDMLPVFMEADPEFAAYVDAVVIRSRPDGRAARDRRHAAMARLADIDRVERAEAAAREAEEAQRREAVIRAAACLAQREMDDLDDMELLSLAVANHKARGGDFVEVWA